MKVILFGSSGMVGQGALRECLSDPEVSEVLTVVRTASGQPHPKVRELVHPDFTDFAGVPLDGDACFWCLGVTSAGLDEAAYSRITYTFTLAAARQMAAAPAPMTFVFVSGTGADGGAMWARVKRKTEEALSALPFKAVYVLRPGAIQPLHGIRSRTRLYNVLYPFLAPLLFAAKLVAPRFVTDTTRVGRAMLQLAKHGYPKKVLENPDINAAAAAADAS